MLQVLINAGHRWTDLQDYSLGEIGVFLRTAIDQDSRLRATNIYETFLATQGDGDAVTKHIKQLASGLNNDTSHGAPSASTVENDVNDLKLALLNNQI